MAVAKVLVLTAALVGAGVVVFAIGRRKKKKLLELGAVVSDR
jgi:D-arabinose 1-dehydrogenase-like Zn-dependent alcohol dehydrogenase